MVSIDGIVAITLFIVFVSWSIVYFSTVFQADVSHSLDGIADIVSDKVVEYLTVETNDMPIQYNAAFASPSTVFYLDHIWPSEGARNSTKVYDNNGDVIACNITGNRIYWQDDAAAGLNYYTITYSNSNGTMNCSGGVIGTGDPINRTIPWSAVKKDKVSLDKVSDMTGMGYSDFKELLGVDNDFRVELNISDSITEYGLPLPNASSVYAKTTLHATEDDENAEIRVMVW